MNFRSIPFKSISPLMERFWSFYYFSFFLLHPIFASLPQWTESGYHYHRNGFRTRAIAQSCYELHLRFHLHKSCKMLNRRTNMHIGIHWKSSKRAQIKRTLYFPRTIWINNCVYIIHGMAGSKRIPSVKISSELLTMKTTNHFTIN